MTGTAAPEREAPEVVCAGVAKTFPTPAGPLAALDTVEVTLAPGSVHQKLVWLGYTGSERTTRRAVAAAKAAFRVGNRRVHRPWVTEPGMWVSDFTYVRSWAGFVYTAFIVDVFAQRILAWHCATTKHVELVATPLRIALWDRDRQGHTVGPDELICHSDAGSQGGFNRSSQHLDLGGVQRWQRRTGAGRPVMFRRDCAGSGAPTGRCVRRCALRGGRIRRVRCNASSGARSRQASRQRKRR